MLVKALLFLLAISASSSQVDAACFIGSGSTGENPGYQYALAFINSLIDADAGIKRIQTVARRLRPADDYQSALAAFTQDIRDYELAARDFDCAASRIQLQEQFSPVRSNELDVRQAELARTAATSARTIYQELAATTREIISLFVAKMKGSLADIEFAQRMAVISADLQDLPREIAFLTPAATHILIDPTPDSSNHLSRLSITARQRNELIGTIDVAFGDRVKRDIKGDRPAFEAAAALLRKWLATTRHIFRPDKANVGPGELTR